MPSSKEWQELVEVLDPVAEGVDQKFVEEQVKDEGNPENPAEDAEAKAKAEESKEEKPESTESERRFTQSDIERIVKERLEREKAAAAKREEQAKRKAAEEAAEKNAEFEELARTRKERIDALEADLEQYSSLEETLSTYRQKAEDSVEARIQNLNVPSWAVELLEGKDPIEKMAFLDKHEGDFAVTERVPASETPDASGTPEADEAAQEQYSRAWARDF
jgi:hypothetical protein